MILVLTNEDLGLKIGGDISIEATLRGVKLFFQTLLSTHSSDYTVWGNRINIGGVVNLFMHVCAGYFIFYLGFKEIS